MLMLLALFLAVTSFFVMSQGGTSLILGGINDELSHILSIIILTVIAISLSYVNSNCFLFTSDSGLLWGSYLAIAFMTSGISYFTEYHIGALLLLWSIYFIIKFLTEENYKPSLLFYSILGISVTSSMIPPMIFLLPVFFIFSFSRGNGSWLKTLLTIIGGVLLPVLYIHCDCFIRDAGTFTDYFNWYLASLSLSSFGFGRQPIIYAIYVFMIAILGIRSVISVIMTYGSKNRVQKVSSVVSLSMTFAMTVIYILYFSVASRLLGIILLVPLSFSIYDFYYNVGKKEGRTFLTIFIAISAALRIYELININ